MDQYYRNHNEAKEDNADVHIKRQTIEREAVIELSEGSVDFGARSRSSTEGSMDEDGSRCW